MSQATKVATVTLNPAIDHTVYVPHFAAGTVNRAEREQTDAGGKGVNVASVLADYGLSMAVTGFLGQENSPIFEQLFQQKQIDDRFVRIAGRTRTGIKIIDEQNQETTDINFPGQTPQPADIEQLFAVVSTLAAECGWWVLAGSIPSGVAADIYHQLIGMLKAENRVVALDTSGQALDKALSAGPTLIKPNIDELQELTGKLLNSENEVVQAAQQMLNQGIKTVIVSMGAEGALFVESGQAIMAQPPKITVKSTVGAGDAMVSGMVAGKIEGLSLADCARLSTAFSLNAITQVGSGLSSPKIIEDFKRQVTIKTLS